MTLDQLANTSTMAQRVRALSSSTNPKPRLCPCCDDASSLSPR
jgi:hypothetical protein